MAVLGFVGNWFFITRYEGKCYITNIENNGLLLNSREKINEISVWDYDQYITSISVDEADDIFKCKMYATYKGNEYEVYYVKSEFKQLELKARLNQYKDILPDDKELGFKYDRVMDMSSKTVTPDEIDSIRVEKTSNKSRLVKKIGLWNRLKELQKEIDNARKNEDASKKQYLDNLYKTVNDVIVKVEMRDLPPSNGSDAGIRKAIAELEDLPNYPALYAAATEVDSFYSEECKSWD